MGASQAGSPRRSALVAEETRDLILQAAEIEFANRGFARARLEDIAEPVGITRAAIIYHFGDKQALYVAVLEAAFRALAERIRAALEADVPHAERVERLIGAWVDYAAERPTLARLFMREVADSPRELAPEIRDLVDPMFSDVTEGIDKGQQEGAFRKVDSDLVVSVLAGATVWFVTNAPLLGGDETRRVTREEVFSAFRKELIGVTRYLLGTDKRREEA
jgi:TetR/AcrR family transcriptional regulator